MSEAFRADRRGDRRHGVVLRRHSGRRVLPSTYIDDKHDSLYVNIAEHFHHDDVSRLHAGDTGGADHDDNGGDDIDKHDNHGTIVFDFTKRVVYDDATHVLVLRTDYDNLAAAVLHYNFGSNHDVILDAARNLVDHVNDDTA